MAQCPGFRGLGGGGGESDCSLSSWDTFICLFMLDYSCTDGYLSATDCYPSVVVAVN